MEIISENDQLLEKNRILRQDNEIVNASCTGFIQKNKQQKIVIESMMEKLQLTANIFDDITTIDSFDTSIGALQKQAQMTEKALENEIASLNSKGDALQHTITQLKATSNDRETSCRALLSSIIAFSTMHSNHTDGAVSDRTTTIHDSDLFVRIRQKLHQDLNKGENMVVAVSELNAIFRVAINRFSDAGVNMNSKSTKGPIRASVISCLF